MDTTLVAPDATKDDPPRISSPAIEARGLVKRYGKVRALDGLDLAIAEGEVYGLIGPNASGKTTLIRILNDLARPTAGHAHVLGRKPGALAGFVGYMPQEEALYHDLSVRENVRFFAQLEAPLRRRRERELLTLVRLWDARDQLVGELSGGTRRRVSLAAALAHEPRVIFLDEPTVGVDPIMRKEFWEEFRMLAEGGSTLLITTHHIEEARRCDRVGLLWRGRMLREGAPTELMASVGATTLEDAFLAYLREAGEEAR